MAIDENEFFRQMTVLICSSLDLETALQRSLHYLVRYMPVDSIFLHLYEKSLGAIRTITEVKAEETRTLEKITPLTREGKDSFEKPGVPNVRIVNSPEQDPVIKKIAESFNMPNSSALVMRLVIEGARLGSLTLTADGKDRYTEEHARLVALLNEPFGIAVSNALAYQQVLKLKDMLTDDNRYLNQELLRMSGDEIVGTDFGLKDVMEMVRKVAPLESPVLLLGETGAGKGVIASAIHYLSPRRKGPFITVNSGAIPETLIDSELFGHEKGAFTGAIEQKRGRFERANHGTIFLDEIGELPAHAQIRMLHVLQEKEIERVGGTKAIPVDIRIIAATHRNLQDMVSENQFREDLWFRINVFPIRVPPVRERKEDIPSLVYHFINKKMKQLKLPAAPEISPGAMDRLMAYRWPGNVRELENVVERELILNKGEPLTFRLLADTYETCPPEMLAGFADEPVNLNKATALHIQKALQKANGIVHGPGGAAAILGINPSTLRSKMKKLGIPYGRKR
ncbi:MAG TPA: sigma 54-interacting transcriptional regulator [Syntrophales bacterium]|nr:sigma 54-interacting transcriptional regulator [Syntrophales bacterium]